MRAVTRFTIDAGAQGLVCLGLAGEIGRLTLAERMLLVEAIVDEAGGALPILVGATAESLPASMSLAKHAEATGATGIVLAPPLAGTVDDNDFFDFFTSVAQSVSVPVVIQDAPEYLGVTVDPGTVHRAAEEAPNIVAAKLETGPEGIEHWRSALGQAFLVFGGNGGLFLLDCIRAGADGVMPGCDTADLLVRIFEKEDSGQREEANRLFMRVLPMLVFEMQTIDHYNACAKHVLRARGLPLTTNLREPAPRLSEQSIARLENYFDELRLATMDPFDLGRDPHVASREESL
jgi:4-hydroxy-tetrahydrodipicolinate synthase